MSKIKRYIIIVGFILVGVAFLSIKVNQRDRLWVDSSDPSKTISDQKISRDQLFELGPGVNLAGAEFGIDIADYEYGYPEESLDYYADKGVRLIRLPIAWERIQPTLRGELSSKDLEEIRSFLDSAEDKDMYVILDLHNYGRYRGDIIDSSNVTSADLDDVWSRLVNIFKDHEAVIAYGVMNEPHDMNGNWPAIAQSSVDAIREVDQSKIILIAGENWSKAITWLEYNNTLNIIDPSDNIVYEAHVYFDPDHSGTYQCSFDECDISLDIGEQQTGSFVKWLSDNNYYGFIGEYGVPSNDQRWSRAIDQLLKYLDSNQISSTIWAGGPDWGDYNLSIEPTINEDGQIVDSPQMDVLEKYLER